MNIKNNKPLYLGIAFITLFLATSAIIKFSINLSTSAAVLDADSNVNMNGFLLPRTLPLASVEFTSTDASLMSTDGFKNQWTLLSLGYTECPDICPTTLLKLDQVLNEIPVGDRPKVAFLSIDIAPDSIDKLRVYMNYFNEGFIGLSTTTSQLDDFFQSLGASYSIIESVSGSLEMEHSSSIYLISPDKRYVANFPYMLTADQIRQDYLAITNDE